MIFLFSYGNKYAEVSLCFIQNQEKGGATKQHFIYVKGLREFKTGDISCSFLFYQYSHSIIEGHHIFLLQLLELIL